MQTSVYTDNGNCLHRIIHRYNDEETATDNSAQIVFEIVERFDCTVMFGTFKRVFFDMNNGYRIQIHITDQRPYELA